MPIEEAIQILTDAQKLGVKHIVFAFWEADSFDRRDDAQWAADAAHVMEEMDWSSTHDRLRHLLP